MWLLWGMFIFMHWLTYWSLFRESGLVTYHVKHWWTESIHHMFDMCVMELSNQAHASFSRSYFYQAISSFVHLKKQYEGLCPYHQSAHHWYRILEQKWIKWHKKCTCACVYCSESGCCHGANPLVGDCNKWTCGRCNTNKCPLEYSDGQTFWEQSSLEDRDEGGRTWTTQTVHGTRSELSVSIHKEMRAFAYHDQHVHWYKQQMEQLKKSFPSSHCIIKVDFIKNIVHTHGQETAAAHYGKRQSQLLTFVVWFHSKKSSSEKRCIKKKYFDYLSSYLKHSSLYFQKCFNHLISYLKDFLPHPLTQVIHLFVLMCFDYILTYLYRFGLTLMVVKLISKPEFLFIIWLLSILCLVCCFSFLFCIFWLILYYRH